MKNIFFFLIILTLTISFSSICNSYDTDNVHPNINENALIQSNIDNFLKNQLGIINGIKMVFKDKRITEWIKYGGKLEDETHCRSKFHFHDPTESWDSAGLSNLAVDTYCLDYKHRSSLVWAQDTDNLWTWQKARQYYFEALTGSNKDLREEKFANTFRSLGQVMHLIADSSVPAHVRNDIHVFPYTIPGIGLNVGDPTFESWTKENYKTLNYTGTIINQSIFTQAIFNSFAPVVISALWDLDKYNESNPDITKENLIGLAEYSNANFFSEDTIFADFSYPTWSSVEEYDEEIDATSGKSRTYLRKVRDGETIEHLATGKWFYKYLPSFLKRSGLKLDENVYNDYAQRLIPRAVGYSAGLLNYFFRGRVEFNKEVYEQTTAQGITGLYLKVKNLTPDEEMKDGEVLVSYKYKPAGETEFTYGLSNPVASGNIPYEGEAWYNFTFPTPIPANATDVQYLWIFKGTLGQEVGAVVGSLIPEPCRITGEWLCKQDEGVSMILTQEGNNITGTWTDLLVYCSPPDNYVSCIANGTGAYNSLTLDIDLIFNTDMYCCCPQFIYEGALLSCDCMAGKLISVCNPTTDATFTRKGSDALCFP